MAYEDDWVLGDLAAQDGYGDTPLRITVNPQREPTPEDIADAYRRTPQTIATPKQALPPSFAPGALYDQGLPPAATPREIPPSFAIPEKPESEGWIERALPKAHPLDPVYGTQRAGANTLLELSQVGTVADLAQGWEEKDPNRLGMGLAGAVPILGKAGKGVKVAREAADEIMKAARAAELANPKLRAKAEALRGTYPQYAEQYPETGPPELMWKLLDKKKMGLGIGPPTPEQYANGKFLKKAGGTVPYETMEEALAKAKEPGFFLEKKLTPEAEKFQTDRNIIQQDMDLHGYPKYFDPEKRFDVDPKKYGPFEDTAVTASPKTAKTQEEWEKTYGTDEIRARLQEGFRTGQGVPRSDRWYLMGQLEQAYIKELGPKAGRAAFADEFARMMAATTGGAAPYDNFLMSHYANVVNKQGERLPDAGWKLPFPIGGRFASGNMKQAQKFIDEGIGNWPFKNAKRYDFSSAFMGNKNAGTIDEQMMTSFDPTLKDKQPKWYGPATKTLREEAAKADVDARGFQDVGWAGLKKIKTEAGGDKFEYEGPMIDQINRSIETTHRLTGMPIAEIVRRGLILKEIPMYGLGGVLVGGAASKMGGIADQGSYQQ